MNKRIILFIFLIIVAFSNLYSQAKWEVQTYIANPLKDDIRLGWFNIDLESIDDHELYHKSFGAGTIIQYNYNQDNSIRFRLGISRTNILEINRITNTYNHGKQDIFHFAPGWISNFRSKRINAYLGFEGLFNLHGIFRSEIKYYDDEIVEISGGYSTGIGALSGFQVNLGKTIFLGAEFSPFLLYSNTGNNSRTYDLYTKQLYRTTKDKDFGITRFDLRFSISMGIRFGKRNDVICPVN